MRRWALALALAGCASTADQVKLALDEAQHALDRTRCVHAALNAWDRAALMRLADSCGPSVEACERAKAEHDQTLMPARNAIEDAYQAAWTVAKLGSRSPECAIASSATIVEAVHRALAEAERLGAAVEACR